VFEHHRLKGEKERLLSELLRDWDLPHPPCQALNANRGVYTLAGYGWNLRHARKVLALPAAESPQRVWTLIRHLLLILVEWKRHVRQLKACLDAAAGWVALVAPMVRIMLSTSLDAAAGWVALVADCWGNCCRGVGY